MSKTTLFDSRIRKYAYREAAQIYKDIGASPDGLSTEQVDAMQEKYGANSFAGRKNDTTLRRLRRAFINPFNVILFILGIISLVTDVFLASDFSKNASTAIIIFSMILISGTIRLIQELRAKNAAQQLDRLIHESITVRRSGELLEIPAEKLGAAACGLSACGGPCSGGHSADQSYRPFCVPSRHYRRKRHFGKEQPHPRLRQSRNVDAT